MSNFVVSARKYRPIRFDNVVGQQHVTNTLKNAIRNDHLAQAFLFCGPRGVGKTTCARILAKVLNCENPTSDTEPCDECPSCKSFNENASLNIHELDAASNNSVEHIRALIEQVRFAPQRGRYKIYIIDEVHMLSQAAFNAFLKTLEEPPSYAIFILATTEKHKIIPTILSRCQIFDFNRIQVEDMMAHLAKICKEEGIKAEEEALNVIAQKADGALRDALSIYDRIVSFSGNEINYEAVIENLNILDYDYYFKIVDAILAEDVSALLLLFDQIQRKGFDGDIFINGLAEHLRNLLVCQQTDTAELLQVSGNIRERYEQQAQITPTSIILSALSIAGDCDVNYKMARNKRLHVEMALIKMAYIQKALDASSLPSGEKKNPEVNEIAENTTIEATKKVETPVKKESVQNDEEEEDDEEEDLDTVAEDTVEEVEDISDDELEEADNSPEEEKGSILDRLKNKKGSLLSRLNSELQEEEEEYQKVEALDWNLENIQKVWNEHVATIESPSIKVLFNTAKLSLNGEAYLVKATVGTNRAKDAILRERSLLALLRQQFRQPTLQLETLVVESEEQKIEKPKAKPNTDRDKFRYFLEKNPLLTKFQKRFDLFPPDHNPNKKR